jgi:hypothetical protein
MKFFDRFSLSRLLALAAAAITARFFGPSRDQVSAGRGIRGAVYTDSRAARRRRERDERLQARREGRAWRAPKISRAWCFRNREVRGLA